MKSILVSLQELIILMDIHYNNFLCLEIQNYLDVSIMLFIL
jgi:hypothetical protein